jgi:beta-lactamase regulating signal transducer with metallopeptidase domain
MPTDVLLALARANLAASAAILVVFALRRPAQRLFGAQLAYALWLVIPAAALGALMTLSAESQSGVRSAWSGLVRAWLAEPGHAAGLIALWLGGAVASLVFVALMQWRFHAAAAAGRAGPAVVGLVHGRMVLPADFSGRFSAEERRLICAHERAHIDRLDTRANGLAVLIQCLGWFNPLLHLAARAMRLDQELACDTVVIAREPFARRRYAETLLKSQLVQTPLPLGCRWVARGAHPLEARITMLTLPPPTRRRQRLGVVAMAGLSLAALAAAWAAQPPQPPWPALVMTYPMAVLIDFDTRR